MRDVARNALQNNQVFGLGLTSEISRIRGTKVDRSTALLPVAHTRTHTHTRAHTHTHTHTHTHAHPRTRTHTTQCIPTSKV